MSRHRIAEAPNEVVVGWDSPLQTFFLEVFYVTEVEEEDDEVLLWLGTRAGEIPTVADLETALATHAELTSHAALTPELRRKLEADQANSTQPSEFQRHMIELLGLK